MKKQSRAQRKAKTARQQYPTQARGPVEQPWVCGVDIAREGTTDKSAWVLMDTEKGTVVGGGTFEPPTYEAFRASLEAGGFNYDKVRQINYEGGRGFNSGFMESMRESHADAIEQEWARGYAIAIDRQMMSVGNAASPITDADIFAALNGQSTVEAQLEAHKGVLSGPEFRRIVGLEPEQEPAPERDDLYGRFG